IASSTEVGTQPLDNLFLNTMRKPGSSKNDKGIKYISSRTKCTSTCTNPNGLSNTSTTKPYSKMQYVEGKVVLDGVTLGSAAYPVVVVVDLANSGTFQMKNNATIYGLLLVKSAGGTWNNSSNNATVYGAVVVENGNINATGLNVRYDKEVYDNLNRVGVYTRVPGSWSDLN
ncbi:MAG: hypothetical protein R3240_04995, partial [Gammaproteobacteria bacterium]|nr:hypothetical protein [Gammaproteobacteria bacterium]